MTLKIECGLDQVLCPEHVRLDAFEGVVFGGRHLLERGGVYHDVDALKRAAQARLVAHVTDEETQCRVVFRREHLLHLELL